MVETMHGMCCLPAARLYVFLMCRRHLWNRELTGDRGRVRRRNSFGDVFMPDILFLAAGLGILAGLALYARALDRL